MVLRRLRKGQHFHTPYLGTREFGAQVELLEDAKIPQSRLSGTHQNLGWMLFDLDFSDKEDIKPLFFKAEMQDEVIDLTRIDLRR